MSEATDKQFELLQRCKLVLDKYGVKVEVDPVEFEIQSPCSLDVEHNEQGEMVCIGVYDGQKAYCFSNIPKKLDRILSVSSFVMHNGMADLECLNQWGVVCSYTQLAHDTMLIGHILDSSKGSYGLKDMAKRELGIEYPSYDEIVGKHKGKTKLKSACNKQQSDCCGRQTLDKQPLEIVAAYNACDVVCTWKLYELQKKELENV